MRMVGCREYKVRLGLARRYKIGLNIVRRGEIGVRGLFLEYGEYSAEYSPTPSLKPLSRCGIFWEYVSGIWLDCCEGWVMHVPCLWSVCTFVLLRASVSGNFYL